MITVHGDCEHDMGRMRVLYVVGGGTMLYGVVGARCILILIAIVVVGVVVLCSVVDVDVVAGRLLFMISPSSSKSI